MASIEAGLCGSCVNAQTVRNRRGSTFLLCALSRTDPGYARYPVLPVRRCRGHRSSGVSGEPSDGADGSNDAVPTSSSTLESS